MVEDISVLHILESDLRATEVEPSYNVPICVMERCSDTNCTSYVANCDCSLGYLGENLR